VSVHASRTAFLRAFRAVTTEIMRPPIRPRHRSEDNIEMDLKAVGWEGVD
jgi:hypothetical protein